MVQASWERDRRGDPSAQRRRGRPGGVPLPIRLLIAVILAVALAIGTSYMLRTLNL